MTPADIDAGRLIVEVGIAPVKPAEFVIFRIQQKTVELATDLNSNTDSTGERTCRLPFAKIPMVATTSWSPSTASADDGNAVKAGCTEVSGLETEVTPIEYRNGNEDITVRKIPGLKKFTNITLKRGMTGDLAIWNWIRNAMKGQVLRAEGSIVLHDENHGR